jgi:hypothetical protein
MEGTVMKDIVLGDEQRFNVLWHGWQPGCEEYILRYKDETLFRSKDISLLPQFRATCERLNELYELKAKTE